MEVAEWDVVLYLCDDVWLFPEAIADMLRWWYIFTSRGVPLAVLAVPGWQAYDHWKSWGFSTWNQTLEQPWRLESVPPNPAWSRCPALFKNPFGACMLMSKKAYEDLGGFSEKFWAHDDVYNHKVWLSGKWVNASYPGRGYIHYGAQSWHHGEAQRFVNNFSDATGMSPEESGKLQAESMEKWRDKVGHIFESLGGEGIV